MKKIKDERLILQNLKNIRIAFIFQSLGILAILIYDGITNGIVNVSRNNPLWLVFMGTTIILSYLNMGISADTEEMKGNKAKKITPLYLKVVLSFAIGAIMFLIMILSGSPIRDSIITGVIFFGCFLIPYFVSHYLRKKRYDDNE